MGRVPAFAYPGQTTLSNPTVPLLIPERGGAGRGGWGIKVQRSVQLTTSLSCVDSCPATRSRTTALPSPPLPSLSIYLPAAWTGSWRARPRDAIAGIRVVRRSGRNFWKTEIPVNEKGRRMDGREREGGDVCLCHVLSRHITSRHDMT